MESDNKSDKDKVEGYLKSGKFASDYFFKRAAFVAIGALVYIIYKACVAN